MNKLLIKIILIGICYIIVSAQSTDRIYFPGEDKLSGPQIDSRIKTPTVKSPNFNNEFICGYEYKYALRYSGTMKPKSGIPHFPPIGIRIDNYDFFEQETHELDDTTFPPIYYLNETAEKLAAEGFNIKVNEIGYKDVLCNFTFSNETFEDTYAYDSIRYIIPIGGRPAAVARAYYMAQIGENKDGKITWFCDGVLINDRWILSAAHCFTEPGVNPNTVRVGDLDKSDFKDPPLDRSHEFIRDYPIEQLIPHPQFKIDERYHDLVLIQIPRPIPRNSGTMFPICLPWDTETNKDLVGMNVTLTGWGATQYNGPKTPRLQEVNLTVFETSVCNEAYSDVPENRGKYPEGITKDRLLCVGWKEDGKDACGGDSGAPIMYTKQILNDDLDLSTIPDRILVKPGRGCGEYKESPKFRIYPQKRKLILAGIVSGGFGCGKKNFPGLYIPINKPMYLQWIKDVAFKDYP